MTQFQLAAVSRAAWPWFALVLAIGVADWLVGSTLPLLGLLVLPVVGASWPGRRPPALGVAVTAAAVAAIVPVLDGRALGVSWVWEALLVLAVYVAVAVLVARQGRAIEQQRRLAAVDALTGALSRATFLERVDAELALARRHQRVVSLLYLDVDDLKTINDTQGHDAGDRHLVALVRQVTARLRRSDVIGRLGGDEFAVLLPDTTKDHAEMVVDRLRRALLVESGEKPIYVSMGLVSYEHPPADADLLLRRADALMYAAKRSGSGLARESYDRSGKPDIDLREGRSARRSDRRRQPTGESSSAMRSAHESREPNSGSRA
jgi:diguanylate cyclase (GGDEF)-like protein